MLIEKSRDIRLLLLRDRVAQPKAERESVRTANAALRVRGPLIEKPALLNLGRKCNRDWEVCYQNHSELQLFVTETELQLNCIFVALS